MPLLYIYIHYNTKKKRKRGRSTTHQSGVKKEKDFLGLLSVAAAVPQGVRFCLKALSGKKRGTGTHTHTLTHIRQSRKGNRCLSSSPHSSPAHPPSALPPPALSVRH
jgi:hypothetical protein